MVPFVQGNVVTRRIGPGQYCGKHLELWFSNSRVWQVRSGKSKQCTRRELVKAHWAFQGLRNLEIFRKDSSHESSTKQSGYHTSLPPEFVDLIKRVNARADDLSVLSENELSTLSSELQQRYRAGETLDDLLPEAFALVREATFRKLGKSHYDVQLAGGIALHRGAIAEMGTGEGKSLTGVLPAYLNALSGEPVFMITVNDYLAKRDAEMFGPVLTLLGMKVLYIACEWELSRPSNTRGRVAVWSWNAQCSSAQSAELLKLPENLGFAIIDEVDQVLIDKAMQPFITAVPSSDWDPSLEDKIKRANAVAQGMVRKQLGITAGAESTANSRALVQHLQLAIDCVTANSKVTITQEVIESSYSSMLKLARHQLGLIPESLDLFEIKEEKRVEISQLGFRYAQHTLQTKFGISEDQWHAERWPELISKGLHAQLIYLKGVHYAVGRSPITGKQGVFLIDENTNRLQPSTKLQEFMHEFLMAKHDVQLERSTESQTKITYARLFEQFNKVAGMTGTAMESSSSLWEHYKLSVCF